MVAACGLALLAGPAPASARPVVAIFDIENRQTPLDAAEVDALTDWLVARIAADGAFEVVPRQQVKARLLEQKLESYRPCYAESCQIELGRELAAGKSLSTTVLRLGGACEVTATLFDLSRATAERAATAGAPCTVEGVKGAIEAVSRELSGLSPPSGVARTGQAADARTVRVPVSIALSEGVLRYGDETRRTHVGMEVEVGLRFAAVDWLVPSLGIAWTVERPVAVTLRPGLRWYFGSFPMYLRTAAAAMVTPERSWAFLAGIGGDVPLWRNGFLRLEADVAVWSASVVPVDFVVGIGHAW